MCVIYHLSKVEGIDYKKLIVMGIKCNDPKFKGNNLYFSPIFNMLGLERLTFK